MVQERRDALTGATREAVLISAEDAAPARARRRRRGRRPLRDRRARGRALIAPIAPGNVQVHWPEGNVLIADGVRSPEAGIPDYNARVSVEPR